MDEGQQRKDISNQKRTLIIQRGAGGNGEVDELTEGKQGPHQTPKNNMCSLYSVQYNRRGKYVYLTEKIRVSYSETTHIIQRKYYLKAKELGENMRILRRKNSYLGENMRI